MIHGVTPVLGVSDSRAAEEFYCGKLGFELQFAYRPFRDHDDPCHMGVKRDDAVMRVSSFSGDGVPRTSVIIWTDNVDVLHEEFVSKGVQIDMGPTDQVWGLREIHVRDADENKLVSRRCCTPSSAKQRGPSLRQKAEGPSQAFPALHHPA